ncbi:sigma-54 interaction domain-containing protein [Flocculibacter collagenilyticus]|uniref:sigma-54 interaction domain-containing protein n=1 Tax=Flocculibacter collagenilyticus TaxID=2744479 RepID=UPI0018F55019|nr:sigma-54 dependent transcriptional regulator [Flocculibacter collagenilyticus]
MSQPKIFIHLSDRKLEERLLSFDVVRSFIVAKSSELEHWIDQLEFMQCDIALIQADDFAKQDFERLCKGDLLSNVEFIFFSQGQPNPYLDKIMLRGAGFHHRNPFNFDILEETLKDLYDELSEHLLASQKVVTSDLDQFGLLVGSSKSMRKLYRTIRKVAMTDTNVLIIGESGAGKELVANTIHLASERREEPFVAINCGALSPELVDSELFGHTKGAFTGAHRDHQGVFEQAEGGTLFLDEVTEMPIEHQVKLLRVLESNEYRPVGSSQLKIANVRIVAATNRDPAQAISDDIFREDLYFRLAQFPIHVPPLRDRGDDKTGLAKHFLAYRNAKEGFNKSIAIETLARIEQHQWPGNVRELKHAIERAYILAEDVVLPEHLIIDQSLCSQQPVEAEVPIGMPLEELEKAAILQSLEANNMNKTDTAKQLGISVKTLYNKLDKYQEGE